MAGFLKHIVHFLSYKEPSDPELGFELLESELEDMQKEPVNTQQDHLQTDHKTQPRVILDVKEFNNRRKTSNIHSQDQSDSMYDRDTISAELCFNLEWLRKKFILPKNHDVVIRKFKIGRKTDALIAYIDGMVNKNTLNLAVLPPLMSGDVFDALENEYPIDYIIESVLPVNSLQKSNLFHDVIYYILNGFSVLFVDRCSHCIIIDTKGYEKRNVEKPITENVVQGPQEGFTESLQTNVTLVRKIIKNKNLVTESYTVGSTNHFNCAVLYLEGVVNPKIVKEVNKRLRRINTDFIMGNGFLEQWIEEKSFTLFPQILTTERPDRTASFIMEGQVVIIGEGTPFALVVPVSIFHFLHSSEDSFVRWPARNFIRFFRIVGIFCSAFLPGLYIALSLYHIEIIPTELLISLAIEKEVVPFPTLLELLTMEVAFELIREGGIRVPSVIGQTLGIVGALILGQTAVSAGLVTPLMIIVVSIAGLGSFTIPNYPLSISIRIVKYLVIFAGAFLGFYGIALLTVALSLFACSLKSFGVPYFAPFAPKTKTNPDVIVGGPIQKQKFRPDSFNTLKRRRKGKN